MSDLDLFIEECVFYYICNNNSYLLIFQFSDRVCEDIRSVFLQDKTGDVTLEVSVLVKFCSVFKNLLLHDQIT